MWALAKQKEEWIYFSPSMGLYSKYMHAREIGALCTEWPCTHLYMSVVVEPIVTKACVLVTLCLCVDAPQKVQQHCYGWSVTLPTAHLIIEFCVFLQKKLSPQYNQLLFHLLVMVGAISYTLLHNTEIKSLSIWWAQQALNTRNLVYMQPCFNFSNFTRHDA